MLVKDKKEFCEDEHWMVRQLVVTEACHIIGVLKREPGDEGMSNDFISVVVKVLYSAVSTKKFLKESPQKQQEMRNVAEAVEEATIHALPQYLPEVREAFIQELVRECEVVQHEEAKHIRDRIKHRTGNAKHRSPH